MMRDAACHVVPLRAGSGTRLKILNAWAMGKAVVSTSIGCEGLAAIDGENILIRDDPKDFADAVVKVLGDHELRSRLGRRGRAAAEQLYSWEVIGENMTATYLALATGQADQGCERRARTAARDVDCRTGRRPPDTAEGACAGSQAARVARELLACDRVRVCVGATERAGGSPHPGCRQSKRSRRHACASQGLRGHRD